MILASIGFRARPHKRSELLSAVDELVERMRALAACERCRLLVDADDPNTFTIASEWQSAGDAEAFFNSREFQIFRGVRMLLKEEPVVVIDDVASRITRVMPAR
jgi:quinol monooxygenase YgiN